MKYILLIVFILNSAFSLAQEETKVIEIIDIEEVKATENSDKEIPFSIIERVPVHANCNESLDNLALKNCMNNEMKMLIGKHFNTNLANDLSLPAGKTRIFTFFSINKEGLVDNIVVRASHPSLKKEAIRLINLIPKFTKPGMQKGKPISVTFALPINFMVEGNPRTLTKKERKALERQEKKLAKKIEKELKQAKKDANKKQ